MRIRFILSSVFTVTVGAVILAGCAADRSVLGHRPALAGQARLDLTPATDISTWRSEYYTSTHEAHRVFYRNEIIRRLMRLDDESFSAWSQKLYGARAISSSVADFATGLMGAFAAASGASAANSLGLAIAGVSGARSAADKDLFLEKSAGALISKMKEDRAKVDAQISQYLDKTTAEYSLEQGLRDIVRYYEAGTLASASETLSADAKVSQLGAQGQVESLKGDQVIAPSEIARAQIEPELPTRTPETQITDKELEGFVERALARQKERERLDLLIGETNSVVNDVRDKIEANNPKARIDYNKLMNGADPQNEFKRNQNGFSEFLRANSNKPDVLKSVQEAAQAQIPSH